MSFSEESSLYELLEVATDATPQEIRSAYLRAKTAYKKDSIALYSLMSEDETETLVKRIEYAHSVLSNPERRKDYDRMHGMLGSVEEPAIAGFSGGAQVVSIDRVPPMEGEGNDDLLVAPRTDFDAPAPSSAPASRSMNDDLFRTDPDPFSAAARVPTSNVSYAPPARKVTGHALGETTRGSAKKTSSEQDTETLNREIGAESEWKGAFLRHVRESRGIALEDLSSFTKISKTYLGAIEDENYKKLPAPVYLRGFVTQLAKALRLPQEKVVPAYMARHTSATAGNS